MSLPAPTTWPQLILFGDSHFQHSFSPEASIGSRLADELQRQCDVINRGFSGYNTTVGKLLLPKIFSDESLKNVAGVIILFGSNDAAVEEPHKKNQHVPLEEFRKNLEEMVLFLTAHGVPTEHIILVSPPPVDADRWDQECRSKGNTSPRSNAEVEKYAAAVYEVAKAHGTLFANLFEDMTNKKIDWRTYLSDGLHLSESGSIAFFNVLFPVVKRMLKAHPFLLPLWTDIDFAEPSALF